MPGDALPVSTWDTARKGLVVIDGIMRRFTELPVQSGRQAREVVVIGLLRRAFVTGQSIAELLFRGQAESAMALSRTLIEIAVTVTIVTRDATDRMARRLVGYDYYWRQKYGHRLLADPETRAELEARPSAKQQTAAISRSWRDQFESPFFEAVRDELLRDLKANRGWHGLGSTDDAFHSVERGVDYLRSFTLAAPFVHGINIEWDFDEVRDGKPFLRNPVEWNGDNLRAPLGMSLFRLHEVAETCVHDRLNAPALSDRELNGKRKEMLRTAKVELYELQVELVSAFGVDPLSEEDEAIGEPLDPPSNEDVE